MSRSVRVVTTMPAATRERLEVLAAADHIGMSEVVRRLIDAAWRDRPRASFVVGDGAWLDPERYKGEDEAAIGALLLSLHEDVLAGKRRTYTLEEVEAGEHLKDKGVINGDA